MHNFINCSGEHSFLVICWYQILFIVCPQYFSINLKFFSRKKLYSCFSKIKSFQWFKVCMKRDKRARIKRGSKTSEEYTNLKCCCCIWRLCTKNQVFTDLRCMIFSHPNMVCSMNTCWSSWKMLSWNSSGTKVNVIGSSLNQNSNPIMKHLMKGELVLALQRNARSLITSFDICCIECLLGHWKMYVQFSWGCLHLLHSWSIIFDNFNLKLYIPYFLCVTFT